jgi:hypothetical protein
VSVDKQVRAQVVEERVALDCSVASYDEDVRESDGDPERSRDNQAATESPGGHGLGQYLPARDRA